MRRITPIGVVVAIAGMCCVVAAYFSTYYYNLYVDARTDLERRCESFELRIAYLEGHKPKDLIPSHALGEISTTDRPASYSGLRAEGDTEGTFALYFGKGNRIAPELRIPAGSTNRQEFDIRVGSDRDTVAGVWLSHAEPYQDLASFQESLWFQASFICS